MKTFRRTRCIQKADIVFIPFYTFLSGWTKDKRFMNSRITNNITKLIQLIPSWNNNNESKPHILIYSDVSWDKEDSFIHHVLWPKNTVLVSLESINKPNLKCLTSVYIPGMKQTKGLNTEYLLSYIGRHRLPFPSEGQEEMIERTKFIFIELEGWKSINEDEFNQTCQSVYTNSVFSLQPPGDRHTRRGFFQSLLCGCIPVIFQDNQVGYSQHTSQDLSEFCIILEKSVACYQITDIIKELNAINQLKITELQNNIKTENYIFDDNGIPVKNVLEKILQ